VRVRTIVGGRPLKLIVRSHFRPRFVTDFWRHFRTWWHAPIKRRDRILGAVVGALGAFWIGCLCRLFLGPVPMPLAVVLTWGLVAAFVGTVLGVTFPKVVACVCFPFATLPGWFA
jgi:hypothetical protein